MSSSIIGWRSGSKRFRDELSSGNYRIEHDSIGDKKVPSDAYCTPFRDSVLFWAIL